MPREDYQQKLESLREDVLYMGEVVAERLRMGLDALEQQDDELGQQVIDRDSEVNELYLDLDGPVFGVRLDVGAQSTFVDVHSSP